MSIVAHILGEAPVLLWGLTSRERLRRMLLRAGVTQVVEDVAAAPPDASLVLLRGDYLYDNRVIENLVESPDVLLQVPARPTQRCVAAHVPAFAAAEVRTQLEGGIAPSRAVGWRVETPETLARAFDASLLKSEIPYVEPITPDQQGALEERLFAGSYKGVTDFITKWLWPIPAKWVTRLCAQLGIHPNHVTAISVVLTIVAGVLFAYGSYDLGLLTAWVMTFLDTVDGKLARVTVSSSRLGHVLDKNLDLIHPPLWYIVWGWGLESFQPGVAWLSQSMTLWLIVAGYIGGRLAEGVFLLWLGAYGIFCWRPIDSYLRLITARRNPNLLLLTLSLVVGRPDLGLVAVACWTVVSTLLLLWRLMVAVHARISTGPLRSWLTDIDRTTGNQSLAVRIFAH